MKIDMKLRKSIAERMLRWILDGYSYEIKNIKYCKDLIGDELTFEFVFDDPSLNVRFDQTTCSDIVFSFYMNRDDIAIDIRTCMYAEVHKHIYHRILTLTRMFFTKNGVTTYKLAEELILELDLMGV